MINKAPVVFKYPISSKLTKTIGFPILVNGTQDMFYYSDAFTVGKKGIFKKNIGCTVFFDKSNTFLMFRVGYKSESSHYYCMYLNGETIAIIERKTPYKYDIKAKIYIEETQYVGIALIAAVEEIIAVANSGDRDNYIDTSAGNYFSRYKEEQDLLNRVFIENAKLTN